MWLPFRWLQRVIARRSEDRRLALASVLVLLYVAVFRDGERGASLTGAWAEVDSKPTSDRQRCSVLVNTLGKKLRAVEEDEFRPAIWAGAKRKIPLPLGARPPEQMVHCRENAIGRWIAIPNLLQQVCIFWTCAQCLLSIKSNEALGNPP